MTGAHPTKEYLANYANGSLSEGMSLLIASHLTFCPSCRAQVEVLESIGASVFLDVNAEHVVAPPLDGLLERLDHAADEQILEEDPGSPLPMPIRREVGAGIEDLPWKFRMPGLHEYELPGFDGEHVSLLRVRPGTGMLHHTHEGEEATLILTGEMEDDGQIFRKGDVSLADQNDNHRPRVVGDEVCYCLIVMTGNMKFTGPVGRALNLLTR